MITPYHTNQLLLTQDSKGGRVSSDSTFEGRSRHDDGGKKNSGQAICCGEVHCKGVFVGVV
jgi:hypothetical protein